MNLPTDWLVALTEALLWPVILALLLLAVLALLHSGGVLREWRDRRRGRSWLRGTLANEPMTERELEGREMRAEQSLARLQLGIRLGPILGLMGTLIPLAPGLRAMAAGEIDAFARDLQVAFTTTVLGLLVGAVFYVLQAARRRWYQNDLHALAGLLPEADR